MKLLLLFVILLVPICVSAQDIIFLQESYLPGETLQAEILTPNLVSDLTPKNILITDNSDNIIKIGFFLKKLSPRYYFLYFNLPGDIQDGFYNLKIQNLLYKENNILKETSFSKAFQINSSLQKDLFTIQPALLEFDSQTPYVQVLVENKESKTITLPIALSSQSIQASVKELTLPANSQITFNVYLSERKSAKEYLSLGQYRIPVWVLGGIPIVTAQNKVFSFSVIEDNNEIQLESLNAELNQEQIAYENLFIKNLLNDSIYNISISLTGDLSKIIELNTTFIPEIKPEEKITEYLLINKERAPEQDLYSGNLVVNSETSKAEFQIELKIIKPSQQEATEETKETEPEITEEPEQLSLINESKKIPSIKQTEEKSSTAFPLIIIGILLLLIVIYFIIPKKSKP